MKRFTAMMLFILLLCSLCGCAQKEELIAPVSFYYLRAPLPNGEVIHGTADSVILADVRESGDRRNDYSYLLKLYLSGPQDSKFRSPYPRNTYLVDFKMDNGTATLVLTNIFSKLTGIDLSLACGCLTMTVLDMTGAERVTILAEDGLLDGKESLTFNRSSFLLIDDTLPEDG